MTAMRTLLFSLLLICSFPALTQDSLLIEAIQKNTTVLQVKGDFFTGPGAAVIQEAIADQQFLLVGEQHGIAEVGQFTKALYLAAQSYGFQYLCIETDPFIAAKLERLMEGDLAAYRDFCAKFPFTIPFYNNEGDFEFLQRVATSSKGRKPVFWGIDQVFAGAPRYLFAHLAKIAPNEEAKDLALDYLEKGQAGVDHFMQTGDQGKTLLAILGQEDYAQLYRVFGQQAGAESTRILQGLQKTQEIYGYYFQGRQFDNNHTRALLMKEQFLEYYRAAKERDPQPKVVFKFGASHMYKGLSYYDQLDIGNMIHEMADMNGTGSLHIYFAGVKGETQGAMGPPQAFDHTDQLNPLVAQALQGQLDGSDWLLIDLRALRHGFPSKKLKPLREIVFSFDFMVLVPQAKPVSQF